MSILNSGAFSPNDLATIVRMNNYCQAISKTNETDFIRSYYEMIDKFHEFVPCKDCSFSCKECDVSYLNKENNGMFRFKFKMNPVSENDSEQSAGCRDADLISVSKIANSSAKEKQGLKEKTEKLFLERENIEKKIEKNNEKLKQIDNDMVSLYNNRVKFDIQYKVNKMKIDWFENDFYFLKYNSQKEDFSNCLIHLFRETYAKKKKDFLDEFDFSVNTENEQAVKPITELIFRAITFVSEKPAPSLLCPDFCYKSADEGNELIGPIAYLNDFIDFVFKSENPWPSLIYFSKFCSVFLPDLALAIDHGDFKTIKRDTKAKYKKDDMVDYYIQLHNELRDDLLLFLIKHQMSVPEFKALDNPAWVSSVNKKRNVFDELKKPLYLPQQTPLLRTLKKLYL